MPLYKVPIKSEYTRIESQQESFSIRTKFRSQVTYPNILPALYVSMKVLLIIVESEDFHFYTAKGVTFNKIGRFDGTTVYLSQLLSEGEYFIGIEEREILQYLRRRKLNKIINKIDVL